MKKEKLAPWLITAAYLILCALFLFSRYAHSGRDELYLSPIGSSAEGWDGTVYLERAIDPAWASASRVKPPTSLEICSLEGSFIV